MITVAELFPLWSTAEKWRSIRGQIAASEKIRLEKEYTIHTLDKKSEYWTIDGYFHRTNDPAWICYHDKEHSRPWKKIWYRNRLYHSVDGPAVMEFFQDGTINRAEWWVNGEQTSNSGPIAISYKKNGSVHFVDWIGTDWLGEYHVWYHEEFGTFHEKFIDRFCLWAVDSFIWICSFISG